MKYILYFIYYYYLTTYLLLFSLFFGVDDIDWALNIVSILIMETASNLENLIMPLTYLDNILNDKVNQDNIFTPSAKDVSVLSSLFSSSSKSDKYIYSTFNSFKQNKTKIIVNLYQLNAYCFNVDLLSLLFNKLVEVDYNQWVKQFVNNCDSMVNLPKKELFDIFNNVEQLVIICRDYPFSLDSLISLITGTKIKTVKIYDHYKTWLYLVISSNEFVKENWRFKFDGDRELEIKLM